MDVRETPTRTMSASSRPAPDPVVVLDRELHRLHPPEVRLVERMADARGHARGVPRDAGDRVDRVAEQVAVVQPRAPAERPHLLSEVGVDERVDDHRGPALCPVDRELEIVDGLHAGMPDLFEELIRELRLECQDEPRRRLTGRIRDDVELDRDDVLGRGSHARGAYRDG